MEGLSVYDRLEAAIAQNDVFRNRGRSFLAVATLDIPVDSTIVCDDSFGNQHHSDLYGATSDQFLKLVTPPDHRL